MKFIHSREDVFTEFLLDTLIAIYDTNLVLRANNFNWNGLDNFLIGQQIELLGFELFKKVIDKNTSLKLDVENKSVIKILDCLNYIYCSS